VYNNPVGRSAWCVFAVVFALMVVDFVDRQVVVSMFPHLTSEWKLSDAQLGALVSIVSLTVAIGTVPLSFLADRFGRVKSIFAMAIVWSLATIACAFAEGYSQLLAARSVVGLGEAAYGAVGAALLATLFPARMRSTILAAFLGASLLGSLLGVALGGVIAERWGWRTGFGVVGIPGLLLAVLFIVAARDYETAALPSDARIQSGLWMRTRTIIATLLGRRTVMFACIGGGLQLVMVSTAYAWLPSYFNRFYGFAPDRAALQTALIVLVSGVGAVICGIAADRLASMTQRARLYVPAFAAVVTAILMYVAFARLPPGKAQLATIIAGAAMMTGTIGPVAAAVIDVSHVGLRATAASVLALVQNLIGLAAGPFVAGLLSDAYGLPFALSVIPISCLLAAVLLVAAGRTYERDLRAGEEVETPFGDTVRARVV
jgi:MFS transporter, Spinster family, sphingosine-1-phosphate transporter